MEHWINMSAHSKFCVYCDKQISLSSLVLSVDARHATSCTCCLPACVVVLKSARTLCRVYRAVCALLYRVCGWCSTTTCAYICQKRPHKIKGFGDESCCKKNDKRIFYPASDKRRRWSLRGQRCSYCARSGKRTIQVRKHIPIVRAVQFVQRVFG